MRKHHSALGGVALALAMTLTGCSDDDPNSDPSTTTSSPTTAGSSSTSTAPTEGTSPTSEPETLRAKAIRLATEQTKAYIRTYSRLYNDPKAPLSILDDYAETQALAEIRDSIQKRRARGERIVGKPIITKTWLGPEKVVFNENAPRAVADLYVCFDLNGSHIVDQDGNSTSIEPQVAQARYAVYAQDWPNESPSDWRVGKEFAAGEPCAR